MQLPPPLTRADVIATARAHIWPPYTSPERFDDHEPLVIVGADGPYLVEADGRRILDAISSWWTITLGHGHPRLLRALATQAAQLHHCGGGGVTHAPIALLAADLAAIAPPGLSRAHFSDDGSTAVEVAIKIAFQYWQQNGRPARRRFVTLSAAYHGDTLGAASLSGVSEFFTIYGPLLFETVRLPAPADTTAGWDHTLATLEQLIATRADELAGVIVEPLIQGAAGMLMYPPAVLRRLRELTTRVDTFLIADEVFTGYGRTGAMWACELANIAPDLLCTAKGFTAGILPMAATLATARVYDGFRATPGATQSRTLMHGHTFCGHPLGAAVAREVLAIYRDEHVLAGIPPRAAMIADAFARIAALPGVRRVRTLGMVGAADLGSGGYHGATGPRLTDAALRRGVYVRPLGDTVYVCPPLNIPTPALAALLDGLHDAVAEVAG
jgi:adenosylmethionine-8-amino-7-oxononanoate aminotransferase